MAMKNILDKQSQHLEELTKSAKQDKIIQLAQLYEEHKIDQEDKEALETSKASKKVLEKALNVDIGIAKDIKVISETVAGQKELKPAQQMDELKESIKDLNKSLKTGLQKNTAVRSGNRPFVAEADIPTTTGSLGANTFKNRLLGKAERFTEVASGKTPTEIGAELKAKEFEKESGLRKFLIGKGSRGEGTFIDKMLSEREDKKAFAKEQKVFVSSAIGNDPRAIALKNLKGEEYAKKDAERRFAEMKAKEKEILAIQKRIDSSKAGGYSPKVKDLQALESATGELQTMDPRRKKVAEAEARVEKRAAEGKSVTGIKLDNVVAPKNSSTSFSETSEDKEEGKAERAKFEADTVGQEAKQVETLTGIGSTLIASLEVHKQMLEALKAGGGAGGQGGGFLDTAMDVAGNLGKRGAGMLGKAGKFIGKNAGKLGAIGGIAMGAYDAYSGWQDASEAEARGEITKDEASVKKGEAVGGGAGGAAGAWGGAAAGAAIGSVVPVVGTAVGGLVGGALGYMGGSAIGSKVGGALTEGYQGVRNFLGFGPKADQGAAATPAGVSQAQLNRAIGEGSGTADALQRGTDNLNNTRDAASSGGGNNIVSAPVTNINNSNTQNNTTRLPTRHEDASLNRYMNSRYAAY